MKQNMKQCEWKLQKWTNELETWTLKKWLYITLCFEI